jgi:hypothetical protein
VKKTYGGVDVYIRFHLGITLEVVSGQLHAQAALPRRKEPPAPFEYASLAPVCSGRRGEGNILAPNGT